MAFHFLLLFAVLNNVFAGSHGGEEQHEEAYWKSVFPNNKMPKALKDILPTRENHRNDGWEVQSSGSINRSPRFYVDDWTVDSKGNENDRWKVQSSGSINRSPRFYVDDWTVDSKGNENDGWKVQSSGSIKRSPRFYVDAWTVDSRGHENGEVPLQDNNIDTNQSFFFLPKDLRSGKLVTLPSLITTSDQTRFLPNQIAKSIPFSSDKLPEILNHFSLKPQTMEADAMNETIRGCERVSMEGEEKFCATSLESFIDLSISKLGKRIQLLSNELSKETKNPSFTIGRRIRNMGEKEIVCHKMEYPAAVFLCHSIDKTIVYTVPVVNKDGTKANALAVCHKDTSAWNPKHVAFEVLKVKPGTVPICHFLVRDTLVWVSN